MKILFVMHTRNILPVFMNRLPLQINSEGQNEAHLSM